jgi:hypothetical protein
VLRRVARISAVSEEPSNPQSKTRCAHNDKRPPKEATRACRGYFEDANGTIVFLHFVISVAPNTDYVSHIARRALEGHDLPEERDPASLAVKSPGPATLELRRHSQRLLELCVVRLVDGFQSYIVDLLREVLSKEPRILKSGQPSLSVEYALQFATMEELISDVVETKVLDLSYQGFERLKAWCTERGITLSVDPQDEPSLTELIATRNLVSHNRGFVDRKYLRTVPSSTLPLGSRRNLKSDDVFAAVALLNRVVTATDAAARLKFGLPPFEGSAPPEE